MKTSTAKGIMRAIMAVVFNCIVGATFALLFGLPAWTGMAAVNAVALLLGGVVPEGAMRQGVYQEIWTGELVKKLRSGLTGSWLDGVPDQSSIVGNDTIHLVEVGVDPEVLVNNTTYPIPLQALDDKDIPVKLDKFQTKVTPITDDELHAITYDKMARVKESHGNAINDSKFAKAAHALCPAKHTKTTPVLATTGARDAATGRLALTIEDLVSLKRSFDALKVPTENRRLVLCPDHVSDLLLTSQTFREQYNIDRNTGRIGMLCGFSIYEYGATPCYDKDGNKKNLDAAAAATDFPCSFAFYTPRIFKATGSTKMYYSEATTDPQNQRNLISFRHYFICMPKLMDACAAIRSGYKAE